MGHWSIFKDYSGTICRVHLNCKHFFHFIFRQFLSFVLLLLLLLLPPLLLLLYFKSDN